MSTKVENYSAGIGDPYWYEWTVGILKIVEMLHPENNISSVTLQTSSILGWDDVRVEFNSGSVDYYQIKHSRTDNTITFGDLVSTTENRSLLSYLASCWKEIPYNQNSKFIFFTNREIGNRKITIDFNSKSLVRPPLNDFFVQLKDQYRKHNNLNDIQLSAEYNDAYKLEWLASLSTLNETEIFQFINQLEIRAGQESLTDIEKIIIEKVSKYLGITSNKALSILQSLDNALRTWCTSHRGSKEKITREDVYEKLGMPANEIVGDHNLEPPYPFFNSRNKEIDEIINSIEEQSNKIIFLTGAPGIGKTSLISKLANNREPYIQLRYYTFKPISPGNDLLPADAGKTTKASALWGDLLSQLRIRFKGNLAKYNFPIRNDFITDLDTLRREVIRLSVELAKRTNQRTVICIDGIDHAARAEIDTNENYLETLIPPDNIPEEILFIISGQPPNYYNKYPIWLKSEKKGVKRININNLNEDDIKILLDNISIKEIDYASQIIYEHTLGNTLSVLYAIETLKNVDSIEQAVSQFNNYQLKDGLITYYNNIWSNSVSHINGDSLNLSSKLACIFSLTAARLKAKNISKVIPEYDEENWNLLLSKLSPLIINEGNTYRVLHNDAKVFFTKIIQSLPETIYVDIASKIFELYLTENDFIVHLHSETIHLLTKARKTERILEIISPKFILEAYIYRCPISEVEDQIQLALKEAIKSHDITKLHQVTCCVKSFNQLQNELQGSDEGWNFNNLSKKFTNELRVIQKELWSLTSIETVFDEALYLMRANEFDRSKGLLERWFKELNFSELIQLLPEIEIYKRQPEIEYDDLSKEFENLIYKYGQIVFYLRKSILKFDVENNFTKNVLAHISSGMLSELVNSNDFQRLMDVLEIMPGYFYPKDFDKVILELLKKKEWKNSFLLLKNIETNHLSDNYKIFAIYLSLLSKNKRLISKWYEPYKDKLLSLLSNTEYSNEFFQIEYTLYTLVCFILGWKDFPKDISEIVEFVSKAVLKEHDRENKQVASKQLFRYSASLGRWFSEIYDDGKKDNFIFITDSQIIKLLNNVLSFNLTHNAPFVHSKDSTQFLLSIIIYCTESTDTKYNKLVNDVFSSYYDSLVYDYHFNIIWSNLYKKGFYDICKVLLNNLLGENGTIWHWQNYEKQEVINSLLSLTVETPFNKTVIEASSKLKWFTIAFSGHKDYNLYYEGIWLEAIFKKKPEFWKTDGIKLLNLSEKVSELGDNRSSNYVNKLLMFGAIKTSPSDALQLYNHIESSNNYWRTYLTDAIIDHFEQLCPDIDRAKLIWIFCCGYLYWSQYSDRKEILHVKNTILGSDFAKSNPELILFMKETNPIYFDIDYLDKIDENEPKTNDFNMVDSIESNLDKLFNSVQSNPELLLEIIKKIKIERPSNFNDLISQIHKYLLKGQEETFWGNNRDGEIYEEFIPVLSEEKKWEIGYNIVRVFYDIDEHQNYYAFSENLNYFCLYFDNRNLQYLTEGYNRILKMHNNWIYGFPSVPPPEIIELNNQTKIFSNISNWSEFVFSILVDKLNSKSGTATESSLQAIWQLIKINPTLINYVNEGWSFLSSDQKEYLLILFELIPLKLENQIANLKPILRKVFESENFTLKMQSYIIYMAINRMTDEEIPQIPLKFCEIFEEDNKINYPFQSILQIEENASKFFSSIKNYHHLYNRRIKFLEAVTGYHLEEYFYEKLSYYISKSPFNEIHYKDSHLMGDFKITSGEPDDVLNTIFEHELANGHFDEFPLTSTIQALLINDDPNTFEYKFFPTTNISLWPKERTEINNADETLLMLLNDGISNENILLCGEIRLYNHLKEYRGFYNGYYIPTAQFTLNYRDSTTFNPRSVFLYNDMMFHQKLKIPSLFTFGGGISKLIYSHNWLIPSPKLFALSKWTINKINPYVLESGQQKVAWLEKYFGPINTVDSRYDRQSAIHRWICNKAAFEEMTQNISEGFEIRFKFKKEVSDLDK